LGSSHKTEHVRQTGAALIAGESLEMRNILVALAATMMEPNGRRIAIRRRPTSLLDRKGSVFHMAERSIAILLGVKGLLKSYNMQLVQSFV
jgi:hypothetical protein